MKKLYLVVLTLLSTTLFGIAAPSIAGIKVGSNYNRAMAILKTKYKIKSIESYGTFFKFDIFQTASTLILQRCDANISAIAIFVHTSSSDYVNVFNQGYEILQQKYGTPTKDIRDFTTPYYKGDGYTTSAIRLGKCNITSYWQTDKYRIIIKINKNLDIMIAYYDNALTKKISDRAKQKDTNIL